MDTRLLLRERLVLLEHAFRAIGRTRMEGVPVLHAGLRVEALGFELVLEDGCAAAALGILVTPWFMNLMRIPLGEERALAPGQVRARTVGGERFEFIGAAEDSFGPYEMCSLFSPMFEFEGQDAARATAIEVLRVLRMPLAVPDAPPAPSRRAFLTGQVQPRTGASS